LHQRRDVDPVDHHVRQFGVDPHVDQFDSAHPHPVHERTADLGPGEVDPVELGISEVDPFEAGTAAVLHATYARPGSGRSTAGTKVDSPGCRAQPRGRYAPWRSSRT